MAGRSKDYRTDLSSLSNLFDNPCCAPPPWLAWLSKFWRTSSLDFKRYGARDVSQVRWLSIVCATLLLAHSMRQHQPPSPLPSLSVSLAQSAIMSGFLWPSASHYPFASHLFMGQDYALSQLSVSANCSFLGTNSFPAGCTLDSFDRLLPSGGESGDLFPSPNPIYLLPPISSSLSQHSLLLLDLETSSTTSMMPLSIYVDHNCHVNMLPSSGECLPNVKQDPWDPTQSKLSIMNIIDVYSGQSDPIIIIYPSYSSHMWEAQHIKSDPMIIPSNSSSQSWKLHHINSNSTIPFHAYYHYDLPNDLMVYHPTTSIDPIPISSWNYSKKSKYACNPSIYFTMSGDKKTSLDYKLHLMNSV